MTIYLLTCIISILTGRGILRLIGVRVEPRVSLYLAPVTTLSFWAILLGFGVSIGFTVRDLRLFMWILTLLLAIVGFWRGDFRFLKRDWPIVFVVLIAPGFVMAPYFWNGITSYLGSLAPDGWSSITFGQYLLEYPIGTEGGLPPFAQYAAHVAKTRFIAAAMLGFFAPLAGSGADTQVASGFYLAWTFFVFSSTCTFVARAKNLMKNLVPFYVTICVFSGWLLILLSANNYDNAMAISFLPAFAGVIDFLDPHDKRWAFILAGLVTALLYCYPEMAPFVLGGACLFCLQRIVVDRKTVKAWLVLLLLVGPLLAIGIAPFFRNLIWFFMNQARSGLGSGVRPGGNMIPELLNPSTQLMAFWGFRTVSSSFATILSEMWFFICSLLSIAFSILAVLGMYELFRRKEWGFATTIIILFGGALLMIFKLRYSYGAYKIILLNWWAVAFVATLGVNKLLESQRMQGSLRGVAIGYAVGIFLLFISLNATMLIARYKISPYKDILAFKKLEEVKRIVASDSIIVSVNDNVANEWAVYFLRDIAMHLAEYRAYMAQSHVVPFMERSRKIDITGVRYALTDSKESFPRSNLSWAGGPYYLWKLKKARWILITGIQNGNGLEIVDGEPFFRLGNGDTEIRLLSTSNGTAVIHGEFILGPSLPDKPERQLLVLTDKGYQSYITISKNGPQTISVPIDAGKVRIILRPLDKPSVAIVGKDPRPLLLGVSRLTVRLLENNQSQ